VGYVGGDRGRFNHQLSMLEESLQLDRRRIILDQSGRATALDVLVGLRRPVYWGRL